MSFCKDHDLLLVNGRLDEGQCTYHTVKRNLAGSSLVDYLLVKKNSLYGTKNFEVLDLNEYSDHCAIRYSIEANISTEKICNVSSCVRIINEKFVWDSRNVNNFQQLLLENENISETISLQTMTGEMTIDDSINKFSNLLHDLSKTVFGKPFQHYHCEKGSIKNPWFNHDCKNARADFFGKKKQYKTSKSNSDKLSFLKARNQYSYIRRKAKLQN